MSHIHSSKNTQQIKAIKKSLEDQLSQVDSRFDKIHLPEHPVTQAALNSLDKTPGRGILPDFVRLNEQEVRDIWQKEPDAAMALAQTFQSYSNRSRIRHTKRYIHDFSDASRNTFDRIYQQKKQSMFHQILSKHPNWSLAVHWTYLGMSASYRFQDSQYIVTFDINRGEALINGPKGSKAATIIPLDLKLDDHLSEFQFLQSPSGQQALHTALNSLEPMIPHLSKIFQDVRFEGAGPLQLTQGPQLSERAKQKVESMTWQLAHLPLVKFETTLTQDTGLAGNTKTTYHCSLPSNAKTLWPKFYRTKRSLDFLGHIYPLGELYEQLELHDAAIAIYDEVIEKDGFYRDLSYTAKTDLLIKLNQFEEAAQCLIEAIRDLDLSDDPLLVSDLADSISELAKLESESQKQALEDFLEGLWLNKPTEFFSNYRNYLIHQESSPDQLRAFYERSLAGLQKQIREGNHKEKTISHLSICYVELKRYSEGVAYFKKLAASEKGAELLKVIEAELKVIEAELKVIETKSKVIETKLEYLRKKAAAKKLKSKLQNSPTFL